MNLISSADLSGMISSLGGVSVIVGDIQTTGIFSNEYAVAASSEVEIDSAMPLLFCTHAEIPYVAHGQDVLIVEQLNSPDCDSGHYYVISIQPDGTGGVWLSLSRDEP